MNNTEVEPNPHIVVSNTLITYAILQQRKLGRKKKLNHPFHPGRFSPISNVPPTSFRPLLSHVPCLDRKLWIHHRSFEPKDSEFQILIQRMVIG